MKMHSVQPPVSDNDDANAMVGAVVDVGAKAGNEVVLRVVVAVGRDPALIDPALIDPAPNDHRAVSGHRRASGRVKKRHRHALRQRQSICTPPPARARCSATGADVRVGRGATGSRRRCRWSPITFP